MSIQTRPGTPIPAPPATEPRERRIHRRGAAVAVAITACVAGLTVLALSVADGSGTEAPSSPGVAPVVVDDATFRGLDRRLNNLAEQHAAQRGELLQLERGADRRLYDLAEGRAYPHWAQPESSGAFE